ncbi:MAG: hypothetical protein SGARI_006766 [Bacillariaceae sp.]
MMNLRTEVFWDVNVGRQAHPGHDAESARLSQTRTVEQMLSSVPGKTAQDHLQELRTNGFVVVDGTVETSTESNQKLGEYLWRKSGQNAKVRTDTVSFLERENAESCGLEFQFDVLMGIASYLNQNLGVPPTGDAPIAPATLERPLTIPDDIQAAEYNKGGFYTAVH